MVELGNVVANTDPNKPMVYFELKGGLPRRSPPRPSPNSPRDAEGYILRQEGGLYIYTLTLKYTFIVRNNSNMSAQNLRIYHSPLTFQLEFYGEQDPNEPLIEGNRIDLTVRFIRRFETNYSGIEALQKVRFPDEIKILVFIAAYQDQRRRRRTYYTKFSPPDQNELAHETLDITGMIPINIMPMIVGI